MVPAVRPLTPADRTAPRLSLTISRQRLGTVLSRGLRVTVTCSEACSLSSALWLDGRLARRLGLSRKARAVIVGRATARVSAAGRRLVVLRFSATARRRLAGLRSLRLTVKHTARDRAGNPRTVSRAVTVRR